MARWTITPPQEAETPPPETAPRWTITPPPARNYSDPLRALYSGVGDAVTFGFGDELGGLVFGDEYKARARRNQDLSTLYDPGWYIGGQVLGSLGTGLGVGGLSRAALASAPRLAASIASGGPLSRLSMRLGAAGAGGAAGGALYGAGSATDDDRLGGALRGAAAGAVGGVGGQAILGEALPAGWSLLRHTAPEVQGGNVVGEAFERFGTDEAQFLKNLERQAVLGGTVMDTAEGLPEIVRGAAARPSQGRLAMRKVRDQVNTDSITDSVDDLWRTIAGRDLVPTSGPYRGQRRSAGAITAEQADNMRARARPLYERVNALRITPPARDSRIRELMARNPDLFEPALAQTRKALLSETGSDVIDETSGRFWSTLAQEVSDELRARLRGAQFGGQLNEIRGFSGKGATRNSAVAEEFSHHIRRMLGDDYVAATSIWAGGRAFEDAVERGYEAMANKVNDLSLAQLQRRITKASRRGSLSELEGVRLGALTRLTDNLENADPMTGRVDAIKSVLRNAGQRRILETLFTGPKTVGAPTLVRPHAAITNGKVSVRRTGRRKGGDRGPASGLTAPITMKNFDDLVDRLQGRQEQFRNTVKTGIDVNSITADKLLGYWSQVAHTRPSGPREWIEKLTLGNIGDRYDEAVSNEILRQMARPAREVLGEVGTGRDIMQWSRKQGLLSQALRRGRERRELAPRRLIEAFRTGLLSPAVGSGVAGFGGLSE